MRNDMFAKTKAPRRAGKSSKSRTAWGRVLKGLAVAVMVTVGSVVVFALLMQWLMPSDLVIKIFNQIMKLLSILIGVYVAVDRGGENGLIRGASVGLLYMGAGVALYAILTQQGLPFGAYLADIGMGVAAGGLSGMVLSNMAPRKTAK